MYIIYIPTYEDYSSDLAIIKADKEYLMSLRKKAVEVGVSAVLVTNRVEISAWLITPEMLKENGSLHHLKGLIYDMFEECNADEPHEVTENWDWEWVEGVRQVKNVSVLGYSDGAVTFWIDHFKPSGGFYPQIDHR